MSKTQTTPTTIYRLERADLLPGHQDGRDKLIAELHGQGHLACVVAGHYQHDTFVVTDWLIVDEDDDGHGYWFGGADGEIEGYSGSKRNGLNGALREIERRYPDADTREP